MGIQARKPNALLEAVNRAVPKDETAPGQPVAVDAPSPQPSEPARAARKPKNIPSWATLLANVRTCARRAKTQIPMSFPCRHQACRRPF